MKPLLNLLIAVSSPLLIASCSSLSNGDLATFGPTNAEYIAVNKACAAQADVDKQDRNPHWFERWMTCQYTKIMPMEISIYQSKEKEINDMYKTLLVLAKEVDSGRMTVQEVYGKWDKMKDEIGMVSCALKTVGADGSEYCHSAGKVKR
jgi:hypothetical protein